LVDIIVFVSLCIYYFARHYARKLPNFKQTWAQWIHMNTGYDYWSKLIINQKFSNICHWAIQLVKSISPGSYHWKFDFKGNPSICTWVHVERRKILLNIWFYLPDVSHDSHVRNIGQNTILQIDSYYSDWPRQPSLINIAFLVKVNR